MKNRVLHMVIGVSLFCGATFGLFSSGMMLPAAVALGLLLLMVYWWITRPVQLAVTALLPILAASLYPAVAPIDDVLGNYFSPIAVLLIGTGVLIAAMKSSGVSKRIALKTLAILGTHVKTQLTVWFLLSLILSMFLPNAVVVATLLPIATAMIEYTREAEETESNESRDLIYIAIAWGAGLGGFGTPLGGAMNLVAINYIESLTGEEMLYFDWMVKVMPYLALLAAGTVLVQYLLKIKQKHLKGTHAYFVKAYQELGKVSVREGLSLALFLVAIVLAFMRPLYAKALPEFKPYYAFLLTGLLAFFIGNKKEPLITFSSAAKEINWGMILLFSGGLAVGKLIISTGAADVIASMVVAFNISSALMLGAIFIVLAMFLANASSNTAAVSVTLPIAIAVFGVGSLSAVQLPMVFILIAANNAAYILPTSVRAIPLGYDLSTTTLAKNGLGAAVVSAVLLVLALWIRLMFV